MNEQIIEINNIPCIILDVLKSTSYRTYDYYKVFYIDEIKICFEIVDELNFQTGLYAISSMSVEEWEKLYFESWIQFNE